MKVNWKDKLSATYLYFGGIVALSIMLIGSIQGYYGIINEERYSIELGGAFASNLLITKWLIGFFAFFLALVLFFTIKRLFFEEWSYEKNEKDW